MSLEKYLYLNGNYVVRVVGNYRLQKRCLRVDEELISSFPDSIDLKITNKCSWGCPYCHESSSKDGKSFNLRRTIEILSQLPQYPIEIAVGGGNILDAPNAAELFKWLNNRGNRTRATVNIKDILNRRAECEALFPHLGAIGVSMDRMIDKKYLIKDWDGEYTLRNTIRGTDDPFGRDYPDVVIHIIAGVFPYSELEELFDIAKCPILVLGYKQWGRAKGTNLPESLENFKDTLYKIIKKKRGENFSSFTGGRTIGFDNLALEQLDIKNLLSEAEWEKLYMGNEGSHSMYVDAVKGEFARTSRSEKRVSWNDTGLIDFFNSLRNDRSDY